jgi:4-diphosphocytidyl-2-C-methyl-D-erythritol kinase
MISFPNAKINLGLQVIQKRADGFHEIETVFVPIPLTESVEFIESSQLLFTTTGIEIPGNTDDNLILKAYHLFKNEVSSNVTIPPLHFHLHKHIPLGAGLGGGSSDASFVLKMLNDYFDTKLSKETLCNMASRLGSDCAFFIQNIPCKATGRGEILEPIQLDISKYSIQLIKPAIHISTAWAYAHINPKPNENKCWDFVQSPIETWKDRLVNDFELPVLAHHPHLIDLKNQFYEQGALYAAMSGSGSTFFALFPKNKKANIKLDIGFEEYYCI